MISTPQVKVIRVCILTLKTMIYAFFYLIAKATSQHEMSILCYHSIGSDQTYYSVTTRDFCKQMDYLRSNYDLVSLEEFVESAYTPKDSRSRLVAITLDDGYLDNYFNAYAYFKKYDISATIFVTTGFVDKKMNLGDKHLRTLSWDEIKIMSKNRIDIGAHTITHPYLTRIPLNDARMEILDSKKEIENKIGKEVKVFAYPFNSYNPTILGLVQKAGFKSAFCGSEENQKVTNTYALARVEIDQSVNFPLFKMQLTQASTYYNRFETILRKMLRKSQYMTRAAKSFQISERYN